MSEGGPERVWGLRGRVFRRAALVALFALGAAQCASEDGTCCCCGSWIPMLSEWTQPELEEVEAAAIAYVRASAAVRAEVGSVDSAVLLRTSVGVARFGHGRSEGRALRIAPIRVEGPNGALTVYVQVVGDEDGWRAVALRFMRGERWVTEGTVPPQESEELAALAIAYVRGAAEVQERVGAIAGAEVPFDDQGVPANRRVYDRVGGTTHVVEVSVTGASGTITIEVWIQRENGQLLVRGASGGGLEIGSIPEVRPPSSGGSSGGGFDWD